MPCNQNGAKRHIDYQWVGVSRLRSLYYTPFPDRGESECLKNVHTGFLQIKY